MTQEHIAPLLILGISTEVFAVASPVLTLLVIAALRYGTAELKAAIASVAAGVLKEVSALGAKVDKVVTSQVEIREETKKLSDIVHTHDVEIGTLKGINQGIAQEQARVVNGGGASKSQVLDAAKDTVDAAVKTVDAAIATEEAK